MKIKPINLLFIKYFIILCVLMPFATISLNAVIAQTVISKIKLSSEFGHGSMSIAANPTTNLVYVVNSCSNDVNVIDGFANEVIATVEIEDSLELIETGKAIAINPATNTIYVSNSGNFISVIYNGPHNLDCPLSYILL